MPDFCQVSFRRSFQCPTGLSEKSRVAIELVLLEPLSFSVRLNEIQCLVNHRNALNFEVLIDAHELQPTNQLDVEIKLQSAVDLERMPEPASSLSIGQHYLKSVALRIE